MPWEEVTAMSRRKEFVHLAQGEDANMTRLCSRFGISRKTGYKWLERFLQQGEAGLSDASRRPRISPNATPAVIEQAVLELRGAHPAWGGRKLRKRLEALGFLGVPAASTITAILKRNGRIDPEEAAKHTAWQSFEAEAPNDLWQMDFKGHFEMAGGRCHPLTVLDDHSRFSLCLAACSDERLATVRRALETTFRRYGLPRRMLVDNGPPWGAPERPGYTAFMVWLIRLGVRVSKSRVRHPQTLGKDERFHRTLKAEVIKYCSNATLTQCQQRFDGWRNIYNLERPHEAIGMAVPISRYRESPRPFPEPLPAIEYGPGDIVRKVLDGGVISYRNREYHISKAFTGHPLALRATRTDGVLEVFFCHEKLGRIDLARPDPTIIFEQELMHHEF